MSNVLYFNKHSNPVSFIEEIVILQPACFALALIDCQSQTIGFAHLEEISSCSSQALAHAKKRDVCTCIYMGSIHVHLIRVTIFMRVQISYMMLGLSGTIPGLSWYGV